MTIEAVEAAGVTARRPSTKRQKMIADRNVKYQDAADRAADGFVRTPADVCERMMEIHPEMGSFRRGARVLEPSAGDGALVRWILEDDRDVHVIAVEPNTRRADALQALADSEEFAGRVTVHRMTFEVYAALNGPLPTGEVDAIIMNPPFGDSSRDLVWMDHIRAAWGMLRPGAQLVSVVPHGYAYRSDRAHQAMRQWSQERGGRYEQLPKDAFAASGTTFGCGLLTVVKPLPPRPDGLPLWLARPATGEPVNVGRDPLVTAAAALAAPVQTFADGWQNGDCQTLCFVGVCFECRRPLWWNKPDGTYGAQPYHGQTVDADASGKTGPPVLLCLDHRTRSDIRAAAVNAAQHYWSTRTSEPAGPRVLPGDLAEGMWVEVTGRDPRGIELTVAGQLLNDPQGYGDGRYTLRLRTRHGADVELSTPWDAAVNHIGNDDKPADTRRAHAASREACTPTETSTPARTRTARAAADAPADQARPAAEAAAEAAVTPVLSPVGGKGSTQLDIWGPLIEAFNHKTVC